MSDYSKIHIFCETKKGIFISGESGQITVNGTLGCFIVDYFGEISAPFELPYEINSVEAEEALLNTLILRSAKRRIKANEKMDLLG